MANMNRLFRSPCQDKCGRHISACATANIQDVDLLHIAVEKLSDALCGPIGSAQERGIRRCRVTCGDAFDPMTKKSCDRKFRIT